MTNLPTYISELAAHDPGREIIIPMQSHGIATLDDWAAGRLAGGKPIEGAER